MAIAYEAAVTSNAAGTGGANYAFLAGNGTRRAKVREIGMFSQAATAANKTTLGRPAAAHSGTLTGTLGQPQDSADAAGTAELCTSAQTLPTATSATAYLRMWDFNNVIGSGVIFTWPSDGELVVGASGTAIDLCIQNAGGATGPASDVYMVWSE